MRRFRPSRRAVGALTVGAVLAFAAIGLAWSSVRQARRVDSVRTRLDALLVRGLTRAETERRLEREGFGIGYSFGRGGSALDLSEGSCYLNNGLAFDPLPQHAFVRLTFWFRGARLEGWAVAGFVDKLY